jgi:hypothetical protein
LLNETKGTNGSVVNLMQARPSCSSGDSPDSLVF